MSINDLKAEAYDTVARIQMLQVRLQELNQKIAAEMNKPKEEAPKEEAPKAE